MKKLFLALLCGASIVPALAQEAPKTPAVSFENGDMETGEDAPKGWRKEWIGAGDLQIARDTTTFHGGKAALRVAPVQGEAKGLIATFGSAQPGATISVAGWLRSQGQIKVSLDFSPRDDKWQKTGSNTQIGYIQNDQTQWLRAEKTFVVPPNAPHFAVLLYIEGTGQAWLDDLEIKETAPVEAAPAPATP